MKPSKIALTLTAALWLPLSALAQDTTTPTDDTDDNAAQTNEGTPPAADQGLSTGEPVVQGNEVGQTYTQEKNGDWELRCIRTEEGNDPCQMYQLISDDEGTPVAEFSLFRLPEGNRAQAGATVVVPLETALQQQVTIAVDGGNARRYPFSFCNQVGCYARIGLTPEDVSIFKRGASATMTIVPALAPEQKVALPISLTGFTATFDKVSVLDPNR
ncbi:MAG: invasion associated locus B family protein [Pseudomonadota bacterium]